MITFIKIWIRVLKGIPSQWEYETSHGETLKQSLWQMWNYISVYGWENSVRTFKSGYEDRKNINSQLKRLKKRNPEEYKEWAKNKRPAIWW